MGETDLISRKDAIDTSFEFFVEFLGGAFDENAQKKLIARFQRSLPSAQPERKKGKWVRITQGAMPEQYICPFCHRTVEAYGVEELLPIRYPYCHCGADMGGEEE